MLSQHLGFLAKKQVPRYMITNDQIETRRETGISWTRIGLTLGIVHDSTLYCRRQELGLHEALYTSAMRNLTLSSWEC